MLDYIMSARWDQAYNFLLSGQPPMYIRLLALNGLFVLLFFIRKAAGAEPMSERAALFTQICLLAANILVLFQGDVERYVRQVLRILW